MLGLRNIGESKEKEPHKRVKDDKINVCNIALEIGAKVGEDDIHKIWRVDRPDTNRTRPVIVAFKSYQKKEQFMSKLYKLKESPYKHIQVKHHLTPLEQSVQKKLAQQAWDMENADELGDFQYRVRGPRWNLQIKKIKKNKDHPTLV